jgi:putative oxidoreductase
VLRFVTLNSDRNIRDAALLVPIKGRKMKIASLIVRILLGLMFFVLGLNPFLNFLPAVLPSGLAGQFLSVLSQSHYVLFIGAVQAVGGGLLLVNRYVPLALTLLGPVIVNILLYHLLLDHAGLPLAIIVAILWGVLFFRHRQYFLWTVCATNFLSH